MHSHKKVKLTDKPQIFFEGMSFFSKINKL